MPGIDEFTKLMLHGDTSPIVDSELPPTKTITTTGGVAITSTDSVFGGSCIYFPGATTDSVVIADSPDFAYGTDPVTVDFRLKLFDTSGAAYFYSHYDDGPPAKGITFNKDNPTLWTGTMYNIILITIVSNGTFVGKYDTFPVFSLTTGSWYHVAIDITSTNPHIYINGTTQLLRVVTALTASDLPNSSANLVIGNYNTRGAGTALKGLIDEYRVSNVIRWTSNFTPSTTAYDLDSGVVIVEKKKRMSRLAYDEMMGWMMEDY